MFALPLLLLLAAPNRPDVRYVTVDKHRGTRVEVRGCDAGLCEVRPSCTTDGGACVPEQLFPEEALSVEPVTPDGQARATDKALLDAIAIKPTAALLVARAQVQTRLNKPTLARALITQALEQAVRDAEPGPQLIALGDVWYPPTVRNGAAVTVVCHGDVRRGRVKVAAVEGPNGWAFQAGAGCRLPPGDMGDTSGGAYAITGLPDGPLQRGTITPLTAGNEEWVLGSQRLRVEFKSFARWVVDPASGARSMLPKGDAIFVGDLDGDGLLDAVLQRDGSCSLNSAWLMLSSKSPDPKVPVTVTSAIGSEGVCD